MTRRDTPSPLPVPEQPDEPAAPAQPPRVLVVRLVVGAAAVVFAALLSLLLAGWRPLLRADEEVVATLNAVVAERAWLVTGLRFVTDLGGTGAAWVLLPLAVVWLLVRRLPLLAAYVAATGLGAIVLSNGIKALVDRVRPVVEDPVARSHDPSFPSGHALGSTVTYGVLLLVFLPVVPRRFRGWAMGAVALLVVAIGLTRVALGVHFPSDVLGGWSLGLVWLAITAAAFRYVQPADEQHAPVPAQGLEVEAGRSLRPAPAGDRVLPDGARGGALLVAAAVLLWGALTGIGLLVAGPLATLVGPVDVGVIEWLAAHRQEPLTTVARVVGMLGSTLVVVVVTISAVAIAVAVTRRRRPAVFLILLPAVETLIYMAAAAIVGRDRPSVTHLTDALPPTASFPSGHVAATVVTYGGIALLVRAWGGRQIGRLAVGAAVLAVVLVAWSRMYRGVHYPTDVLGSVLYASAWLAVCWAVVKPGRPAETEEIRRDGSSGETPDDPAEGARR